MNWKRYFTVAGFFTLLIIIQFRNPEITGPFKGIQGNILNPVVYYANRIGNTVSGAWNHYIWLVGVSKENDELRSNLDTLTLEHAILSEKVIQLEKLSQIVNFKDTFTFSTVAANVISRNTDGYMKSIIIDRGEIDGVSVNDPVVSVSGLVGKVSDVYRSSSRVILLYDHESNVSVINTRTRAVGILKGDGYGGLFVDYYDRLDNVKEGDVFISSGMGMLYPKGLRVGKVSAIEAASTGLFQRLTIECSVDFYKLEQVLVVNQYNKLNMDAKK